MNPIVIIKVSIKIAIMAAYLHGIFIFLFIREIKIITKTISVIFIFSNRYKDQSGKSFRLIKFRID